MITEILDPQVMTAGGYAMESVAWFTGALMMVQRLARAGMTAKTLDHLRVIFRQRAARLAVGLGVLLLVGFTNRFKWFRKHTFTDEAYIHSDYEAFLISVIVTVCMFTIVNNINGKTDRTLGVKNNQVLLGLSLVAFVLASAYYVLHR